MGNANESVTELMARCIRDYRGRKGWTQSELGRHAGVDRRTINSIELCKRSATIETLDLILRTLNCTFTLGGKTDD